MGDLGEPLLTSNSRCLLSRSKHCAITSILREHAVHKTALGQWLGFLTRNFARTSSEGIGTQLPTSTVSDRISSMNGFALLAVAGSCTQAVRHMESINSYSACSFADLITSSLMFFESPTSAPLAYKRRLVCLRKFQLSTKASLHNDLGYHSSCVPCRRCSERCCANADPLRTSVRRTPRRYLRWHLCRTRSFFLPVGSVQLRCHQPKLYEHLSGPVICLQLV